MTIGRFDLMSRSGLEPVDPVIVPYSVNCFYDKVGKRSDLTKINLVTVGTESDPDLGCVTSARLLIMRPVVGKSSFHCPCASREL